MLPHAGEGKDRTHVLPRQQSLLESCKFVLVAEVLCVLLVQGVGAVDLRVTMAKGDVGIAVELELEKFSK